MKTSIIIDTNGVTVSMIPENRDDRKSIYFMKGKKGVVVKSLEDASTVSELYHRGNSLDYRQKSHIKSVLDEISRIQEARIILQKKDDIVQETIVPPLQDNE